MKLILSFILSFSMWSCADGGKTEEEIIVAPKGYKGYILVIFDQKNGAAPKYEGKKRVYEIPANGILKTRFSPNDGWMNLPEFYYEKISTGNKLPSFVEFKKLPTDTVAGFIGSTGSVKKNSESEERVKFAEFFIGTKDEINQAGEDIQKLDIVKLAE